MDKIVVALIGQPNVGKSSLINALSGANLKVGNFTGVTIERAYSNINHKGYKINFVDLPGVYSLSHYSPEERVSTKFLHEEKIDVILNVLDCTNLERNLPLSLEILALGKKTIVVLNMMDEARNEHIKIDLATLKQELGVEVIGVSTKKAINLEELLDLIVDVFCSRVESTNLNLNSGAVKDCKPISQNSLLERVKLSNKIASKVCIYEDSNLKQNVFDKLLMHKFLGIPIFLFLMWLLFQLTFTLGDYPKTWIENGFKALGVMASNHIKYPLISSLIGDGILGGVGAVLSFLPNILIVFLGIVFLESTGYMARVAYLLDGALHKIGLHGKSFVPLIMGFGCSVPAFMATRTLKNHIDKLITLFVINFMSCSARIPIYVLFVGVFFEGSSAGNVLFLIYTIGALIGLICAKLLRISIFKGKNEPFVLELPKYRLPSTKLIVRSVYNRVSFYIKKAGTSILLASLAIWFLYNYPNNEDLNKEFEKSVTTLRDEVGSKNQVSTLDSQAIEDLEHQFSARRVEQSYLGRIGHFIEPIFAPMELDWRLCVSLLSGLWAKEITVSTMGVLYSVGEGSDEQDMFLQEKIAANVSLPSAIAFILIVMFYMPCLAASVVFTKESGGIKYVVALFVFTSSVAYICAFIGYKIAIVLV